MQMSSFSESRLEDIAGDPVAANLFVQRNERQLARRCLHACCCLHACGCLYFAKFLGLSYPRLS